MSKITIDLTQQQEAYLKEFAAKHYQGSKNNNLTAYPIHLVQTRRTRVVDPNYDNPDIIKYCVPDWGGEGYDSPKELIEAFYEDKDCPIEIVSFDEAYNMRRFIDVDGDETVIVEEEDYLEAYGIDDDFYYKVCIEYVWETVAVFFILDEAKRYMKYQEHNLTEPRTYTIGAGYGNKGEYHHFWELLFDIGKQLNVMDAFKAHALSTPEGYIEVDKDFCSDKIKQVGLDIRAVNGVFVSNNEMVITGSPNEDDESHNCDELGCSSVNHVLYRQMLSE